MIGSDGQVVGDPTKIPVVEEAIRVYKSCTRL